MYPGCVNIYYPECSHILCLECFIIYYLECVVILCLECVDILHVSCVSRYLIYILRVLHVKVCQAIFKLDTYVSNFFFEFPRIFFLKKFKSYDSSLLVLKFFFQSN